MNVHQPQNNYSTIHCQDDPEEVREAVKANIRKKSRRKRKAGAVKCEAECDDRDHWEECTACQQWVNLGKGQGQLQGMCGGCGAVVAWQEHAKLQSWVQCDACGRWRSVPDHILRYDAYLRSRDGWGLPCAAAAATAAAAGY